MYNETGSVSIHAENIFPIIKKWLYSEKDIFIRELVSNSSDAISKLKKLSQIGEAKVSVEESFTIKVEVNKEDKTIKVIDNGIGMTGEEVKKYINQIAFSGAKDFVERYKDKTDENQIIGHFGLGFYSAFMVSTKVRIDTLSHLEGQESVGWESEGGTEYEMGSSTRNWRGTTVTLYVAEDSEEFLEESKMREVLTKYFSFLPYELYIEDTSKEAVEKRKKDEEEKAKKAAEEAEKRQEEKALNQDAEDGDDVDFTEEVTEEKPLNDTHPLWLKNPKECTAQEYKTFYTKVFHDFNEPLFWIHLNMDYPFRLQGILYFPKLRNGFEGMEGQIKLYYNQVFVADNIKEVIPEFLMLLKGVLDCPDLPLNVSRSFLQNDGYVNKISAHINKKVADKLKEVYEKERENYNQYWDDINPFVKYGCIKEQKFYDRVKDIVVYKTIHGKHINLNEYLEGAKEKHENQVFYVTDERIQSQYIRMFKDHGIEAVILNNIIDNHFIQTLEGKESGVRFLRIDTDVSKILKNTEGVSEEDLKGYQEKLEKMFRTALNDEKLKVQVESLKAEALPCMITQDEYMRRFADMSMMQGGGNKDMFSMFSGEKTLVVNANHEIVKELLHSIEESGEGEELNMICQHLYDMACLTHGNLEPEAMHRFINRNNQILSKMVKRGIQSGEQSS
jgi:molecular chaperone HtpG